MKTLINSLYLLSMYYMSSNNIIMHKFGIENNYISMAMNTMLGKTNNTVKSMNVSETNAMVIDNNWGCILYAIGFIISVVLAVAAVYVLKDGFAAKPVAIATGSIFTGILSYFGMDYSCNWPLGFPFFKSN